MWQYCSNIYFIFVLCIIVQVHFSIERENVTTEIRPSADIIPEGKCDSNVTLCSCDDIREKLMYTNECCMSMSCNDAEELIVVIEVFKSAYLPARILPGFRIGTMSLGHPKLNVDKNIFEEISYIEKFKVYESNIQVIYSFFLKLLKDIHF